MSDLPAAEPYQVAYTPRVLEHLRALASATTRRGDGERYLLAVRDFDRRLRIYPQFGDPLSDLQAESGQIRLGVVVPLTMRYAVF